MNEYENYDVRELIEGCRNREDFAFAELVGRYTPMMNKVIHSFSESDQSYDDMFVEATVALHTAALKFDVEQSSVTFGLFARICVHHRLVDYVRSSRRDPEIVDYDIDLLSDNEELEAGIVTRETVRGLLKGAEKILSDFVYYKINNKFTQIKAYINN